MVNSHKDLVVWQKSIELIKRIYLLTDKLPKEEFFGLISQMRRCAISIASNIAEGRGRKSTKEFTRFLKISLGSIAELDTQLIISLELDYISEKDYNTVNELLVEIRKITYAMVNKLDSRL